MYNYIFHTYNRIPSNCAYTKGPIKPESEVTPPSIELKGYFNSGLLVLTPSKEVFKDMVTILHRDVDSINFPDQDLLNQFFKRKMGTTSVYL